MIYEKLLQDLEGEVRGHIRFQKQLELHIETIERKSEELEAENVSLTEANVYLLEMKKKNEETEWTTIQTEELKQMQEHVQSTI